MADYPADWTGGNALAFQLHVPDLPTRIRETAPYQLFQKTAHVTDASLAVPGGGQASCRGKLGGGDDASDRWGKYRPR